MSENEFLEGGAPEPKWEKAHPQRRVLTIAKANFGNWRAYNPLGNYVLFGKVDRTNYKGLVVEHFGFFGDLPYGIVLKVGPDVKYVEPGHVVDFTAGFWLEDKMSSGKDVVRPNTVLHTIYMEGHEYGLVNASFITGIRAQVNLEDNTGIDEESGDYYEIHYDKSLIYYAESEEKMSAGIIKRKEPLILE